MVFSYAGSGSISPVVGFDFGNISYSYTPSSILQFIYVDLGTLGAPTATIDHGSVTEPITGQEDWGDMRYDQQTRFPFGVVRLASSTTFVVKKVFVGSGQLFELGEAFTRLQAPWIVEGTISLRGEANAAFLYRYDASGVQHVYGDAAPSYSTQYEGSGSLFSGSFAGEAVTKVFPEDFDYTSIEGSLTTLTAADLSSGYNAVYDGSIYYSSSGSGTTPTNGFAVGPHVRFGTVTDPGSSSSTNRKVEYTLDLTDVEEITFRLVMGNGSNGGETPDNGEDLWMRYLDTGLSLNDASRKLLDHAETTYTTPGDKTVTVPVEARRPNQTIRIYQLTWSGTYEFDHYGFISLSYGSEVVVGGDGDTRKTLFEIGSEALVLSSLRHIGSGTLFNIGSTQPLRTFAYDGSGTLFGFGNETRSLTYSYPGTVFFTYEDYGQVTATTTQPNEDFGSLFRDPGDDVYEIFDRGEILVNYTKSPFGLFKLRSETIGAKLTHITGTGDVFVIGDARTKGPQNHYGEGVFFIEGASKTTFSLQEFGSGFISTLSGAAQTFSASPEEKDKLLNFRGVASQSRSAIPAIEGLDVKVQGAGLTRFIPRYNGRVHLDIDGGLVTEKVTLSHLGTGVLFDFIGAEERRVYSYNTSSIDFITHPDYGSVANAAAIFEDYGDLDLRYTGETGWMSTPDIRIDYQGILDNYTNYPFGLLPLKGAGETSKVRAFSGSGTLTVGGDVFIFVPPVWDGQGVISIKGSAEEAFVSSEQFQTLFEFKGTLENFKIGRGWQGTGRISTLSGAAEAFTGNPTEREALFSFRGVAQSRFIPRYNGRVLLDIDGGLVAEKVALAHQTTGSLFSFVGADQARVYSYNSTSIDFFVPVDLGSVAAIPSTNAEPVAVYTETDFGTLDLVYTGEQGWFSTPDDRQDWQYILDHDTTYPFGLFERFSGTARIIINLSHFTGAEDGGDRLFKFRGEVELSFPNVHSGTGGLTVFGAATSEKIGVAESFNVLFEASGSADVLTTFAEQRDVEIELDGNAGVSFTGNTVQDATIFITGASSEIRSRGYQGTGFISTLSGAAESFTGNPVERQLLFDITGQSVLRATKAHEGSGTLFGLSGAAESTTVDEVFATLFNISGASTEVRARGYEGTGRISTLSGVAESFTASPDDLFSLFDFTGGITSLKSTVRETAQGALFDITGEIPAPLLTFTEQPEVQARIFGAGSEAYVPNWSGRGRISTLSGAAESITINARERELLFSITGSAEEAFSFGNYDADSAARIFGSIPKPPTLVFAESGFGTFTASGEGEYINVDVYGGFGTIFAKGIGGESVTRRIPAFQADLALSGFAGKAVTFNPPDITTHLRITGEGVVPIRIFAEVFTVRLATDGTARERFVSNHIGDGAIASRGIGGEAISRKLPAFQADMFVSGFAGQSITVREQFFGSLFTFSGSSAPELLAFAEEPEVRVEVSGESKVRFSLLHIGEGRISTLSGAAESATFNPKEKELLFSFGGGFSDIKIVKAETKQIEISVDVDTDYRFIPNWIVEGTISISGIAHTTRSIVHTGEGFISALSGAAESFTYNPTEDTALFSFFGTAAIRSAVSEVRTIHTSIFAEDVKVFIIKSFTGSGVIPVSGQKEERTARAYEGTGVISTLSGSAESFTVNPEDLFSLFNVLGVADTRPIKVFTKIGSGALFTSFTAGEARTISVPVNVPSQESKGLFKLEGSSPESFTIPYEGSGSLFSFEGLEERRTFAHETEGTVTVSGIASTPRTRDYEGSGSLFSFIEAESAVRFVPSTRTVLFDITGESVFKTTQAHEGTGSLFTTFTAGESRTFKLPEHLVPNLIFKGAATIKNTYQYQGQNNLEITGSAQESFTPTVYEGDVRLKTSGESVQKFVTAETSQGGTIKVRGESSVLLTNAFDTYTLFDINGIAKVNVSSVFAGSGTVFTFVSSEEVQPDKEYQGSGTITLRGESVDKKVNVAPERTYGWII